MRIAMVLLLMCTVWTLRADDQPAGNATPTEMSVRSADIRQIELDTQTGKLSFSVAGRRYLLAGHAESDGGFEAVAAAKLGIMNELRRCDQVAMSVVYPEGSSRPGYIVAMVLKYDSLKP